MRDLATWLLLIPLPMVGVPVLNRLCAGQLDQVFQPLSCPNAALPPSSSTWTSS